MSQSAEAHFLRGMSEANAGRIVQALQAVGMAVSLADRAEYLGQYARLLVQVRREAEGLQVADRAAALKPSDALTLDTIGCVYSRLGAHDRAAPLFAAAVAQQPDHVQMRYNLASSLGFLGRFEDAAVNYEALIAMDPGYTRAHFALSSLKKQSGASNHIKRLEALLPKVRNSVEHLHVRYALAKECEDLADHDASFGHLEAANRPRKVELGYSIDSDRKLFARLMDQFARDDYFHGVGEGVSRGQGISGDPAVSPGRGAGDSGAVDAGAPIFIFGMPRTGTTLVDRILSSHPLVESAGELQVMQIVIKRLTATASRVALDPQTIDAAARLAPIRVGADYLEGAAPHRKTARRFIDKLPLNFLYAGYIARALPSAKLICLRRDPLDTVWSNYRHLFATGYSYYSYSFDLMDTARYYVLFDRLMRFWEERFPGRILQVQYESLVDDQEAQTRRLLEHCALPWNEACLSFHENASAVATPSATQVRQPLYRTALGRWRRYERYLQPVREYFESEGITSRQTSYETAVRSPADG
jgi:tetratricopeptide (TPR) repeat protein